MSKIKIIALSMLAMAVVFSSCKKDEEEVDDPLFGPTVTLEEEAVTGWHGTMHTIEYTVATGNGIKSLEITNDANADDTTLVPVEMYDEDAFDGSPNEFTSTYSFTMPAMSGGSAWSEGEFFTVTFKAGHSIDGVTYTTTKTVTVTYEDPIEPFTISVDGAQLWSVSAPVGFFGAYDLVTGAGVASASDDADKDMRNLTVGSDWVASWDVPSNGTLWVKADASFDYDNANNVSVPVEYAAGTPSGTVLDVVTGDVYVARLRGGNEYVVIKITDVVDAASNEDYIEFSYKKQ